MGDGIPYCATLNLHSDIDGVFERVDFSSVLEKYIIRKNIYKKPGDEVNYFANAANTLGIVFFRFPDRETMMGIGNNMNKYANICILGGDSLNEYTTTTDMYVAYVQEGRWAA